MADPRLKTIRIKSGVVKRLTKEIVMYGKEAENQRKRIETMKAENKDEYNIKKQEEVLQESLMMIPDCRKRLNVGLADLKSILDSEQDLAEVEEYQIAVTLVSEAEAILIK